MHNKIFSINAGFRYIFLSTGMLFILLLIYTVLMGEVVAFDKNDRKNAVYAINSPRANNSYFSFSRKLENGDNVSVVFNLKDKSWKVFKFAGSVAIYPKPSQFDNDVLYFTYVGKNADNQKYWSIIKCTVDDSYCQTISSSYKIIGNFTEIANKGYLFSRRLIENNYKGTDIFLYDPLGNFTRKTEFLFYQVGSFNVLKDQIVFFAYAPKKHLLKRYFPETTLVHDKIEGVFSFPIDAEMNLKIDPSIFQPLIKTDKHLSKPSVIDQSTYMAVLQRATPKGPRYRYDLAIYDLRSGELYDLIKTEDFSFSRPTLLKDGRVIYLEYVNKTYKIYSYTIETKQVELLTTLSANGIANANIQTLQIAKEL